MVISSSSETIREIPFHIGLNLIVDETERRQASESGNSVGKTTVLKLVDFCLGAKANIIYQDSENRKNKNEETKAFLEDETRCVLITLILCRNILKSETEEIVIERNFLKGKKSIRRINGKEISDKDFTDELSRFIFTRTFNKPTFNQLIAHNIRYTNERIENCLKFLNPYTKASEYEALFLYMFFGDEIEGIYESEKKITLEASLKDEINYCERLTFEVNLSQLESKLGVCENNIQELECKRKLFTLDEDNYKASNRLSELKTLIGFEQQSKNALVFRRELILRNIDELKNAVFNPDLNTLHFLYNEVKTMNLDGFSKTFEDLVNYHNSMIKNKISFFERDLPDIEQKIVESNQKIVLYTTEAKTIEESLKKVILLDDYERLIIELQNQSEAKGELTAKIDQIRKANKAISSLRKQLSDVSGSIYCDSFKEKLQIRIDEFNMYFSKFSHGIYGEQYLVSVQIKEDRQRKPFYDFSTFNHTFSSGKKMGEILSFDMAYVHYAKNLNIPSLSFLLNDKKELMDINQIEKASEIANEFGVQLVFSLLSDKLADKPELENYVCLKLSQHDKLFRF